MIRLISVTPFAHGLALTSALVLFVSGTVGSAFQVAQNGKTAAKAAAPVSTKPDPRVGKKVIVTVHGAALRTPEAIVWKSYVGETFTIAVVNGEWLWASEKGGWLWEKEAIPFDTAIAELTARIAREPSAENFHLRGIAHQAHEEYSKAVADFSQSLGKNPGNAGVLNNRGQTYYQAGVYDKAVEDFNAAISIDKKHFVAMNNRALCSIALANYDSAILDLNAALVLNKEYPEALNNRGVVHSKRGDFKAAIADFSAALKIDAKYTDAYGNRAFAYRRQGLMTEALTDLKLAAEKDPLNFQPINDLAWIYATTQDSAVRNPADAVKLATQACQMCQYNDWNAVHTLAAAYASAGDFKAASQWIATALEKAPANERKRVEENHKLIFSGKPIND